MALMFGQLTHEIPKVQCVNVRRGDAGFVQRSQSSFGKHIAAGPLGMFPELGHTCAGDAWIAH
jgi:hypothetical protein